MSDLPEGPGWWLASDQRWYPPELHSAAREHPSQFDQGLGARSAQAPTALQSLRQPGAGGFSQPTQQPPLQIQVPNRFAGATATMLASQKPAPKAAMATGEVLTDSFVFGS